MSLYKRIKGLEVGTPDYLIGIKSDGELFKYGLNDSGKVGWSHNSIAFDSTIAREESLHINFQTDVFDSEVNIRLDLEYNDNGARTIGTLNSIGKISDVTDWSKLNSRRVIISAESGSWFNIKNNGTPITNKTKPIITMLNSDIVDVVKAVFTFDSIREIWLLESYELLASWQQNWFRRYSFNVPNTSSNSLGAIITGLKYKGYYEFDVYCSVYEKDASMNVVNTMAVQSLEVAPNGGSSLLICKSPYFVPVFATPMNVNTSLQGSGILFLNQDECINRSVNITVTLPNGVNNSVEDGYLHVRYLGPKEGQNC
jgi:hypothetical protein